MLFVFPALRLLACGLLLRAVRRGRHLVPFPAALLIFAATLGTLAVSSYPHMIPFAITTVQAAAPPSSLSFMFWSARVSSCCR